MEYFDNDSINFFEEPGNVENAPSIFIHNQRKEKLILLNKLKMRKLKECLTTLPSNLEIFHLVTNASVDFFMFVPLIIDLTNLKYTVTLSTWSMSMECVDTMIGLYDSGKIHINLLLSGDGMQKRRPHIYWKLFESFNDRGLKFRPCKNHAELILMCNEIENKYYVIERSAHMTSNPRLEQHVINNNKELYDFHKSWMDNLFL